MAIIVLLLIQQCLLQLLSGNQSNFDYKLTDIICQNNVGMNV